MAAAHRFKSAKSDSSSPALGVGAAQLKPISPGFTGFVVAIGASAGGLEALERFFHNCPSDTGAAFVVIQHLSPDHKSLMHELLSRYTRMKVQVVADAMPVQANQVYLIPPGAIMRLERGQFLLTPKSPHLLALPIDIFFHSLAEEQGNRAIGVILSGTGSDGTRGAVAVNAAGGFLLAQEPRDARFDGMPNSVIGTGLVDAVLSADQLAARLVAHINNVPIETPAHPDQEPRAPLSSEEALEAILQLLLQAGGIDFHDYKRATLLRRIERRMQVRHLRSLDDYLLLLEQDRAELSVLRRELLIPVTSFFRDPEAFDALRTLVVEPLVDRTESGEPIRVWVAGCSTGEEAYSIAMLFLEAFAHKKHWPNLKVFATDVNQQNIDIAAAGLYPDSAAAELTPERLEHFFHRNGGAYTVKAELRQCIVFARHNLLVDPPFTRMSLVSCRNTLIYFTADAQRRALNRLQYAIQPEGYLFLGSSESIAGSSAGFSVLQAKHKLFKRNAGKPSLPFVHDALMPAASLVLERRSQRGAALTPIKDSGFVDDAIQALLQDHVPPTMLVNERREVIHMFGDVAPFFQVRPGAASLELNRLLPEAVVPVASALLYKAEKDDQVMVSNLPAPLAVGSKPGALRLTARPLRPRSGERLTLLSFQSLPSQPLPELERVDLNVETAARVEHLERELSATRENLQATIEELETANEELQATNEEMMAANEELQSSNEELQSVNEELNTVNAEFQEKMSILNRVNADLDTMTKAVGVATVFVDEHAHITRFSPDVATIFKLRESDIGRPLDEITHNLHYPEFLSDIQQTLHQSRLIEREVRSADGRFFLARILPYAISSTLARGALATFVDITVFHDRQRLQGVLDALPEHVAVLESDGTIAMVNAAWRRFALANGDPDLRSTGVGVNYLDVITAECNDPNDEGQAGKAWLGVRKVLEGKLDAFGMQYPCHSPTEKRWFMMNVAPIRGPFVGAVVSHFEITAWYEEGAERAKGQAQ